MASRRLQHTIFGTIIVSTMVLSMVGFGFDMGSAVGSKDKHYAIRVNNVKIKHNEFYNERRELERRYRMMLGDRFSDLLQRGEINLSQVTADNLITKALIQDIAEKSGLTASKEEVAATIRSQVFPQGFNRNQYERFLSQQNMTAVEFEQSVKDDIVRQQFGDFLKLLGAPSNKEIDELAVRDLSKYTVTVAIADKGALINKVSSPKEEELKEYYDQHSEQFQLPLRISYDYVVLEPKLFNNLVQISPEDIELYYGDNQSKYSTSEEFHPRHIEIKYPTNASEDQKKETRTKAEAILKRIIAKEDFAKIAQEVSDDANTKSKSGDLGWMKKGHLKPEVEAEALRQKDGNTEPQLVETSLGFEIVALDKDGYKAANVKPLDTVRAEIEALLKKEREPEFLSIKATELLEEWSKSGAPLSDFAKQHAFTATSTNGHLDETKDPEPRLAGLTAKVLEAPDNQQQLIELKGLPILVQVSEFKDSEIPAFDTIKDKVTDNWKKNQAKELAESLAQRAINEMIEKKYPDLKSAANALGLTSKELKDISSEKQTPELTPDATEDLFNLSEAPALLPKPYLEEGKWYVVQCTAINRPSTDAVQKKAKDSVAQYKAKDGQMILSAVLNALKQQADIDQDAGILTVE